MKKEIVGILQEIRCHLRYISVEMKRGNWADVRKAIIGEFIIIPVVILAIPFRIILRLL